MALTDSLLAYYSLSDTSDATGNGNTLTNQNTCTFVSGLIADGASQGTSNTNKSLYRNTDFGIAATTAFTVSMWVKCNNEIGSGSWNLFTLGNTGASSATRRCLYDYNGGTRQIRFMRTGFSYVAVTSNLTMGTSNFYHIVYVYNGTTFTGYVNNSSVGTSSTATDSSTQSESYRWNMGAHQLTNEVASFLMDETGVWNRALTTDEISQLYNGGAGLAYPLTVGGAQIFSPTGGVAYSGGLQTI